MIPRRVTLRGFLSYRDERSLDFTDAPLWMLAGENGSGKSAVFDAVTYALFGAHRNGSQNADELINKESDGLAVEFEFSLGENRFEARRTLKRNSRGRPAATQQILQLDASRQQWQPVPETSKKKQFDAWISENIGLRYETFTTSVLLLQGHAERLLSQTPADRFKVLADIVDLERYVRLHARVDEARKKFKATNELLQNQFAGVTEVAPAELEAAQNRRAEAERQCKHIAESLDHLRIAELAANRWAALQQQNRNLHERRARANELLANAPVIERNFHRLQELRAIIPRAEKAMTARGGIETSRRAIEEWKAQQHRLTEQATGIAAAVDQTRRKRDSLNQELERNDAAHTKLSAELPGLAAAIARLDLLQMQRRELQRAEERLRALPADLDQRLTGAIGAVEELTALDRALPALTRLRKSRQDLIARTKDATESAERLQAVTARGEELKAELTQLESLLVEQRSTVARAQEAATGARTLHRQAQSQLESFRNLDDAKLCRLCGQELTPEHREQELQSRTEQVAIAIRQSRDTDVALSKAAAECDTLIGQFVAQNKECDAKRDEYRGLKQRCGELKREIDQLKRTIGETFAELPDAIRFLVTAQLSADWTTTTYPTADDLNSAKLRVAELTLAREQLRALQAEQKSVDELRGGVESLRRSVGQLTAEAPAQPDEIRQRQARIESDLAALSGRISARRVEAKSVQAELERLAREHTDLLANSADLAGRLRAEHAKLELTEQALSAAYTDLPDGWRPLVERAGLGDQQRWKLELDELAAAGLEQKAADLQMTRASVQALAEEESAVDATIAAVPTTDRRALTDVESEIQIARQSAASAEVAFRGAHDEFMRLENLTRQRDSLNQQLRISERDHQLHALLAELLGRDRLQRHLVRRAERQIVDHASAILDRLSGGELHLRLRIAHTDAESAFDLEVINRAASAEPIAVAFLSGSQRFRVAVSLALGVGRYASGGQRSIESVIIDEGFGCLDRNGRQVMIQELQNLRGFLKRILLVSHQEEFADAFSDGYHFELVDGSTRVTRVQR